jgi:ABC-type dipeptide/oligopeptide/nickel transport system permease subunit
MAERAVTLDAGGQPAAPVTTPRFRERRWVLLKRALSARGAPFGATVLIAAVLVAIFAPLLAPYDPLKQDLTNILLPPSPSHLLGTDNLGRDIVARVLYGTRVSLIAGLASVTVGVVVGSLLGLSAGFAGGRTDGFIMRFMDAVLSFPGLVLALALGAVIGAGLGGVVIALGVVYTPTFARLMRGQVLTVRTREYVIAARVLGSPGWRIVRQHVLPNVATPIVVQASLSIAFAILAEASLSFLGLGTQPPDPSWGTMVNTGQRVVELSPWPVVFPGLAIVLAVLAFNLIGDGLRDALDPRLA